MNDVNSLALLQSKILGAMNSLRDAFIDFLIYKAGICFRRNANNKLAEPCG